MQAFQEKRQEVQDKFAEIDERWNRVEEAIRIQTQERNQDLTDLHQKLSQNTKQTHNFQTRKNNIIAKTLGNLSESALDTKENVNDLLESEAQFRLQHLDKKNAFIQNYSQGTNNFCNRLQQYSTQKIGDISNRLQSLDSQNRNATEQTLKEIKDQTLAEAKHIFSKEKEKYTQLLNKVTESSTKQIENLRQMLKNSQKQRQESESKLKLMIDSLMVELQRCYEDEAKEGEVCYDSLLKLLEESCDRIQEAQLR